MKSWTWCAVTLFIGPTLLFCALNLTHSKILAAEPTKVSAKRSVDIRAELDSLIEQSCLDCHDSSTDTNLNLESLTGNLDNSKTFGQWEKIFDRISKGEMPPKDSEQPNQSDLNSAIQKLKAELLRENIRDQTENGRVILRRLTRQEYEYTLQDLLQIRSPIKGIIPAENSSTGFDTVFNDQGISSLHIESYLRAADYALDQAIQLGRLPKTRKQKFEYTKQAGVLKHLKEGGQTVAKKLDDAIVMFGNASYIYKVHGFHPEQSGTYRFRISTFPYQAQGTLTLAMHAGDYRKGFTRVLKYFDLKPQADASNSAQPQEFEFEAHLFRNEYVFPAPHNLKTVDDGKSIWNLGPDKYKGEGIAIRWIEIEGPLHESWPPPSTSKLLKGVQIAKLPHTKWANGEHIDYEIVAGKDPKSQVERILKQFAPRALRRELTADELTPFLEMANASIDQGRTLEEAVRVAIRGILTSPQFLFMLPKAGRLDDYSLASRLSYFLWKTTPDNELLRLARSGKLSQKEVLRQQVERMLNSHQSKRFVKDFVGQWLQLNEIEATTPDRKLYPEFDELLRLSMIDETEEFFGGLIREDLSTTNLIDSKFAFLNRRIAEHYEIEGVQGQEFRKVNLPDNSPRGGIMTHASVLKVTANGTTTSPVRRGAWVLTQLLGQPPSPPPPNVGSVEPDTRGATTIREILNKHRNDAACASCHRSIDPPGFALECFDVIGGFRENYRSLGEGMRTQKRLNGRHIWEYKIGLKVDPSGQTESGKHFDGVSEFKQILLSQKEQVARNLISKLIVYSTGAKIQFADREIVEQILERAKKSNYGLRTILHEFIESKIFLNK